MVLVTFTYNGEIKAFNENPTSKIKEIFKKFSPDIQVNIESFIFLYNGQKINEDSELKDLASNINKNEIKILVYDKDNYANVDISLSKYPICPKCGGIIRIDIKDYKIKLFECNKGHEIEGLTFQKFIEMQQLDETKIICDNCKQTNKANSYKKQFYKCFSCKMNLCPLCKSKHDNSHLIISYDEKEFKCLIHNDSFNSYCNECKKNICIECEDEHGNHDIISLGKFIPNKNNLNNYNKDLKDKIDKFNEFINELLNKINELAKIINIYYKIVSNHIEIYQSKKRNYQLLQNINDFQKDKIILDDISEIINENDIKNKIDYIFRIYNKIKGKQEIYENTMDQNKYRQLNENNEQKYLEEKNKLYEDLRQKYEKENNDLKKKNEILNKELREEKDINEKYLVIKKDVEDKLKEEQKKNEELCNYNNQIKLSEKNKYDELNKKY